MVARPVRPSEQHVAGPSDSPLPTTTRGRLAPLGSSVSARSRLFVLGIPLAAAAVLVAMPRGAAQGTATRWVIEPGPEAADAQKLGAADVERAQQLAKTKDYKGAANVLEALVQKLPAAVHDCNLALVYLRASALTRAQLMWDLSGLRNGTRPKWCTGDVSTQLSQALRVASYVPMTIDVVPADAMIEVGGVAMRSIHTVWLPQGPIAITASAPGRESQTINASVAAPSARIAITLEAPRAAEPDAGVAVAPPIDAAPVVVVPVDAAPVEMPVPATGEGTPAVYRYVALSTAVVGWIGAGVFGVLTVQAKDDANGVYVTDPSFAGRKDDYDTYRWATLGSIGLGVVASAVTVYLFTRDDGPPPQHRVQVGVGPGSFGITFGGTFGGGGGGR